MALKLASATFVLLLLGAHALGDRGQLLAQPLSLFRDEGQGWLGYPLFAALLLIGLLYLRALIRAGKEEEAVTAGLASLLLFVVAVTPSLEGFHLLSSLLLLLLLFGHFWRLLRDSRSPWLIAHTMAPFILVLLSGCHSYGLWQKSIILYLVILANIRHHLLGQSGVGQPLPAVSRRGFDGGGEKRRKAYRLELEREWARCKVR